ncbi:hypothetical protein DX933_10945 [Ornithinibacillus gellani]|uniref:hypothetical protein n=1 Tax=Ornithinibacillus gellani TaxID=2293253 RepID=UPI000F487FC2|nr:hypothetical protein [Ornithinibacillus gellani]TQS74459.1 hypothetical protein DX933_10945 [Ornithinibacillus gellani]
MKKKLTVEQKYAKQQQMQKQVDDMTKTESHEFKGSEQQQSLLYIKQMEQALKVAAQTIQQMQTSHPEWEQLVTIEQALANAMQQFQLLKQDAHGWLYGLPKGEMQQIKELQHALEQAGEQLQFIQQTAFEQ